MSAHSHEEQDRTRYLVNTYEDMLCSGELQYIDSSDFECVIHHYDETGRLDEALLAADYALEQHSYTTLFYLRKARLLIDKSKEHEALDYLDRAESIDTTDTQIFLLRARAYQDLGEYGYAYSALERAELTAAESEGIDIYLAKALYYEEIQEYEQAFESLKQALLIQADHEDALMRIWFATEVTDSYKESIELHQQLINQHPYNSIAWYNLGYAYYNLAQYDKAADSFEYAYVIDQKFRYAYCERAESLIQLGLYEKAIECLELAYENIEAEAFIHTRMGFCFEQLDNIADAESYYLEAIRLDAAYDDAYFRLGECYFKRQKWEGAKGAYESAFCLDKKNAAYLVALAETHYQLENYTTAVSFFQEACDMAPDECKNWIRLATFHASIKDFDTAITVLEEAEMYNCGELMLDYCKIACLYQVGRYKQALQLLENTLLEDEERQYELLFDFAPNLKYDDAFVNVINAHI